MSDRARDFLELEKDNPEANAPNKARPRKGITISNMTGAVPSSLLSALSFVLSLLVVSLLS
jgi:hypothetical protein